MADAPLVRFAPGAGTAFVAADRIALTADGSDSATARALRSLVARGLTLADAMTELSRLGFAALAAFAVVIAELDEGGQCTARVLHRGDVGVRVERATGGAVAFHQPQIATWREEVVEGVLSVRLDLGVVGASALTYWSDGPSELPAGALGWSPRVVEVSPAWSDAGTAGGEPWPVAESGGVAADNVDALDVAESGADTGPVPGPVVDAVGDVGDAGETNDEVAVSVPIIPLVPIASAAPVIPPPAGEADDIDFANLVDHTVFRSPEEAAVRAVDEPAPGVEPLPPPMAVSAAADPSASDATRAWLEGPAADAVISAVPASDSAPTGVTPPVSVGAVDPDHDGHTVARRSGPSATPLAASASSGRPMVHAVHCPSGHLNPPSAPSCRVCELPIADRSARTAPRPQLGVVRFSTGHTAVIDGPLLVGRNPPSGVQLDGEEATVVAIDDSEISRSHLALYVADWYVSVEDQGSTNGTVVRIPGKADRTLRPFERVQVVVGTVVDVGGAVTFRYDAT